MAMLRIQFITDRGFLIPDTDMVSVRGQVLEVGPKYPGAGLTYFSPAEQLTRYGEQIYILLAAYDDNGSPIKHDDIDVLLMGEEVEPGDESTEPGVPASLPTLKGMREGTDDDDDDEDEDDDDAEEEGQEAPQVKRGDIRKMKRALLTEFIEENDLDIDPDDFKGKGSVQRLRTAVIEEYFE